MSSTPPILHENLPLIEVADSVLLDIIAADPQARKLILARLSNARQSSRLAASMRCWLACANWVTPQRLWRTDARAPFAI